MDKLAILLFVGKADGRLMRPERLLTAAYLESRSGETDEKLIDNAISYGDVPSLTCYKRAVGRVAKENMHVLWDLYECPAMAESCLSITQIDHSTIS